MSKSIKNEDNSKTGGKGDRSLMVRKELATEDLHDRIEKYMSQQRLLNNRYTKPVAVVALLDSALKQNNL